MVGNAPVVFDSYILLWCLQGEFLVGDFQAHAACCAADHAYGCFEAAGVEVGHFLLGDLFDLGRGDFADLGFVWHAAALL